jgi:hypothetical protein
VLLPRAIVVTRDAPEAAKNAELPARPVAAFAAAAAMPGPAGPVAEPLASEPSAAEPGLPRRVRQDSLAPQLKNGAGPPRGEAEPAASGRTPEESRSFLEDLQHGWLLARSEPDPLDGSGPAAAPRQAAVAEEPDGM